MRRCLAQNGWRRRGMSYSKIDGREPIMVGVL
jgi:hypothetical protein